MTAPATARRFKVGIDVGGTFTDFYVREPGREPVIHKVLSTPADPSVGVLAGLRELAGTLDAPLELAAFLGCIEVIVHGTTVTTNATLTRRGAKTGLITTAGVRDALEMRRGIREERYNNRYTNVAPVVPRYLRVGVTRTPRSPRPTVEPLKLDDVRGAIALFKSEDVKAVAICFMNAFANPAHEAEAAALVREELPGAFLTTSTELLPAIRFYDRVSHHRAQRLCGADPGSLPGAIAAPPERSRFCRRAADHAIERRRDDAGGGAQVAGADAAFGSRRRPDRRASPRRDRMAKTAASSSTWAAPVSKRRWSRRHRS